MASASRLWVHREPIIIGPMRQRLRGSLHVSPRKPDGFVEAAIRRDMPVVDTDEPTVTAAAPANPSLFKQQCEPPPDGGIFGIGG
jgi:hypothetical protein